MKNIKVNEEFRVYILEDFKEYKINGVVEVYISDSGSHRVLDVEGLVHYIPKTFRLFKFKGKIVA